MRVTARLRMLLRFHNSLFVLLLLAATGLLAHFSREYGTQWDLTRNSRNSLSRASLDLLRQMPGPVLITAYATPQDPKLGDIRRIIREFVGLYTRAKPDLTLRFIDPAEHPQLARAAGIQVNGEMVIEYRNRNQHLTELNEQALTNALMRLARGRERLVLYLEGHGERRLDGAANHDLGDFGRQLESKGFKTGALNLALVQEVPHNTSVLLVAGPQTDLLPGEADKLKAYLARGGNLLWLIDPEPLHGLEPLAEALGLALTPGIVVDPNARQLNAAPTVALGAVYGPHPITRNFNLITAFPLSRQIGIIEGKGWHGTPLVEVAPQGWVEMDQPEGEITYDKGRDIHGPITIAMALERQVEDKDQRVAVVGGGSFLSNTYLGNGGNLDLGVNLVNWLAGDQNLITIQPRATADASLDLSRLSAGVISIGFLIVLPLLFLGAGIAVWVRRRRS